MLTTKVCSTMAAPADDRLIERKMRAAVAAATGRLRLFMV
jgi:hypothetical protein